MQGAHTQAMLTLANQKKLGLGLLTPFNSRERLCNKSYRQIPVKQGEDESKCAFGLPQTRAHSPTTGGVFISFEHTGHHLILKLIRKLSHENGWSLARRGGILTTRIRESRHNGCPLARLPNSRGAQDQGRTASVKLSGATST